MSDQRHEYDKKDSRSSGRRDRGPPRGRDSNKHREPGGGRHGGRDRDQHRNRRLHSRDRRRSQSPGDRSKRDRDYDEHSRRDRSKDGHRYREREDRGGKRDNEHGGRSRGGGHNRERGGKRNHPSSGDPSDRFDDSNATSHRTDRSSSESLDHQTLPTRSRQDLKKPTTPSMSFNVTTSSRQPSNADPMHHRGLPSQGKDKEDNLGRDRHQREYEERADEDEEEEGEEGEVDLDDAGNEDMAAMQAMMGFGGFGSTKGTKVSGNDVGGVRKEKKNEYRQYMNRQGGFNRPLSPGR